MNYNIVGYFLYLLFTLTVIIKVGLLCYKHGKIYSLQIFNGNKELTQQTNTLLLLAYYLFNFGYCFVTIYNWQKVHTWQQCLSNICEKAGFILFMLGVLHIINMLSLIYFSNKQKDFYHF